MSILVLILGPVRGSSFRHSSTSGLAVRDQALECRRVRSIGIGGGQTLHRARHRASVGSWRRILGFAGLAEGWLLVFDLRKAVSWVDKLFVREVEHEAKQIRFVGC